MKALCWWTVFGCLCVGIRAEDAYKYMNCHYQGQYNFTTKTCVCVSGWTGPDCSQRLCAVGRAWADFPTATDTAHARWTECSAMGYCDRDKGECVCRSGFEGAGCQYLACPTNAVTGETCSNRGKCMTMREAAASWNGRNLVRPNILYDNWDADQIQGCVCDKGYSGYECGTQDCPAGDDPLTEGQENELMQVACQADGGYWFFSFGGATSRPIPYNAGHATVQRILEEMASIERVDVTFSDTGSSDLAPACGASAENVMTIEFLLDFGPLSAARVDGSKLWLGGDEGGGSLAMVTTYQLACGGGSSGSAYAAGGSVYLVYGGGLGEGDVSAALAWDASADAVRVALQHGLPALSDPAQNPYGNTTISVGMLGSGGGGGGGRGLCPGPSDANPSGDAWMTNVTVRCLYGNLLPLRAVNSLLDGSGGVGQVPFAVGSYHGTKEHAVCNNHGTCTRGACKCDQSVRPGTTEYYYRYSSSDGVGGKGGRGDCGHQAVVPTACPRAAANQQVCNGRGTCDNATLSCHCHEGFSGAACDTRACPTGPAWFDEATGTNQAHAPAVCSGRGACDGASGVCQCDDLFEGSACQRLRCASNSDVDESSQPCSGHGRCLPLWQLARLAQDGQGSPGGFTYGDADSAFLRAPAPAASAGSASPGNQWDRGSVQGCACDSRNDWQPANGPVGRISGVPVENPRVGGWTGYDCSRKWCPTGDDALNPGVYERQVIACTNMSAANMTFTFRTQTSRPIAGTASHQEVEAVLEAMTSVGDVLVAFNAPNGTALCDPRHGPRVGPGRGGGGGNATVWGAEVLFLTELGDLPLLVAKTDDAYGRTIKVHETVKGTKANAECSNRGYCDYSTGSCQCLPGFAGSAGNYSTGLRRDCGRRSDDGFTLNPYYIAEETG